MDRQAVEIRLVLIDRMNVWLTARLALFVEAKVRPGGCAWKAWGVLLDLVEDDHGVVQRRNHRIVRQADDGGPG